MISSNYLILLIQTEQVGFHLPVSLSLFMMNPYDCKLSLTHIVLSCRCQTGHRTALLKHRCEAKGEIFGRFSPRTQLQEATLASSSTHHTQAMVPFLLEQRAFSPKGRSKGVRCCQEQGFWQRNAWSSPDLADPTLAGLSPIRKENDHGDKALFLFQILK